MKLGKATPKHDSRTLLLSNYLVPELQPPPSSVDWTTQIHEWGMMLNDKVGCCTCATAAHMIQTWTSNEQPYFLPTDDEVIYAYSSISGYEPSTGLNDNGAAELDVLNYWRKTGIAGHKIYAFASISPGHVNHIKNAVWLFGWCYLGLALPLSAQGDKLWDVWDVVDGPKGDPGSWGGHAVPIVAYDEVGPYCVTWGELKHMTWAFFEKYCDEAYAILSVDWYAQDMKSPNGFDVAMLQRDLKSVAC